MSKITRSTQKAFASSAGTNQLSQFGSFAANSPVRYTGATVTAADVQALSVFLGGLFSAVVGDNSAALEDVNSLFWLAFNQLGYLLQTGVPEWDSGTTYYKGSVVTDASGNGTFYISLTDSNTNNAVTDTTNWKRSGNGIRTVTTTANILSTDDVVRCGGSTAYTVTLPTVASTATGHRIVVKNVSSNGSTITIAGNGAENIDGSNTYTIESANLYESVTLLNNGTSWDVL